MRLNPIKRRLKVERLSMAERRLCAAAPAMRPKVKQERGVPCLMEQREIGQHLRSIPRMAVANDDAGALIVARLLPELPEVEFIALAAKHLSRPAETLLELLQDSDLRGEWAGE